MARACVDLKLMSNTRKMEIKKFAANEKKSQLLVNFLEKLL